VCSSCGQTVATEYYDINGRTFCGRCRDAVEAYAETPRGAAPLVAASLFGLGAAVAGAIIYYAVLALLHLEIGIVAILIGYMVGYPVRKSVNGRGGRRFQILAAALTYAAVALAYAPNVVKSALEAQRQVGVAQRGHASRAASSDAIPAPDAAPPARL